MLLQLLCNSIAACLAHFSHSSLCLFFVLHSPSIKWLLPRIFLAVHRFYDQVKVGTCAKVADPNCHLFGIRGDASQPACTLPSPASRRLNDDTHVAPFNGSFFAAVGRLSTFFRYQVMWRVQFMCPATSK